MKQANALGEAFSYFLIQLFAALVGGTELSLG
jgi:hypothetical protein